MKSIMHYRITLLVATVAIVAIASPTLSVWLELDYAAVAAGQWWRIWTGHLTHYDPGHLFWDLLMFVVLGSACERSHRRMFAPAIIISSAAISAAIGSACDGVAVYRGLSGLDTGLFVWFLGDRFRQALFDRDRIAAALWLVPAIGLVGKLLYEATTGQTLFVDSTGFRPLVEAHLAGVASGLACCIASECVSNRSVEARQPTANARAAAANAVSQVS